MSIYDESYPPSLWGGGNTPSPNCTDTGQGIATSAIAGSPGTWLPADCLHPFSSEQAFTYPAPTPATAFTSGQFMPSCNGQGVYWNGTDWVGGHAP